MLDFLDFLAWLFRWFLIPLNVPQDRVNKVYLIPSPLSDPDKPRYMRWTLLEYKSTVVFIWSVWILAIGGFVILTSTSVGNDNLVVVGQILEALAGLFMVISGAFVVAALITVKMKS